MCATLNIMKRYAQEQVASQMSVREQEDEDKLHILYARSVVIAGIAYLRADGFRDEFHENRSISGLMRETLSECIYAAGNGEFGRSKTGLCMPRRPAYL